MHLGKRVFLLVSLGLLGIMGSTAGCGGVPDNAAAVVDGHVISKDDVARRIDQLRKVYSTMIPTEADVVAYDKFRREVTDQLVREELERQETDRRGLTVSNDEIQQRFQEMAEENFLGDVEALKQSYADKGMSEEEMIDDVKRVLLHEKLQADVGKEITVTDEDAMAFYERNKSQYVRPEMRQARQLIADNEAVAADAINRVRAGESFIDVLSAVSIDPDVAQKKGALGFVSPGQLAPPLDQALFNMSVGQISNPINVGQQWYVLSLEGIQPPLDMPFEQVKNDVILLYGNQQFSEKYKALVSQVYEDTDIAYDEEYDPALIQGTETQRAPVQ